MEADPKHHPNLAAGESHGERLLAPCRYADQRPAKRMRKRTEQADVGQARTARKEGMTHMQLVKTLLNLREWAQTKRTSAAQAQRSDAERTWANA